jgi:excinuclease ABC subunit C
MLLYFGEFEKIKSASIEELKNVLNEKDATVIYNYFNNIEE